MLNFHLRCCLIAAAALLFLAPTAAQAQDLPGSGAPAAFPGISTQSGDLKLPIEGVKPYSDWSHHVAEKPEEAIVLVRYGASNAGPKTTVTGLVIRCDGFVLVPRAVRDVVKNGGVAEVVLSRADGEKLEQPTPAAARQHPFSYPTVPYALIKINDHHIRSLPILSAPNVRSGDPVTVCWATPEKDGITPAVSSVKAKVGSAGSARDSFSLADIVETDAIPPGAVVVDTQSGAAVGYVTQGGAQCFFDTFAKFYFVSGDVGMAPDRASVRLGDRSGTPPSGGIDMVWIPGGPVALDGAAAQTFTRNYKTTVGCTPGFWMAVQPVTNGEYRRWLGSARIPGLIGLPAGWLPGEIQIPIGRREDRPVCGVIHQDAAVYAAAHQSRLPTEIEWRRASYVRDTGWAEDLNAMWDDAAQNLGVLVERQQMHFQEVMAMGVNAARQRVGRGRDGARPDPNTRTNILIPATPELAEDSQAIMGFVETFLRGQWSWGQVAPIDAFRQDVSIFGVKNVVANAPELVLSRAQEGLYAPKRYPAGVDPDLTSYSWEGSSGAFGKLAYQWSDKETPRTAAERLCRITLGSMMIRMWHGGRFEWSAGGFVVGVDETGGFGESASFHALVQTSVRPGFRCAR